MLSQNAAKICKNNDLITFKKGFFQRLQFKNKKNNQKIIAYILNANRVT